MSIEELRNDQRDDSDISPVISWKERDEKPRWRDISDGSEVTKSYLTQWDSLILESGVLKRRWETQNGKVQVFIDQAVNFIKELMNQRVFKWKNRHYS